MSPRQQPTPTTLLQMPPGIWQLILRHLDPQEAAALRLTCSSTRRAVDNDVCSLAVPLQLQQQGASSPQEKQQLNKSFILGCGLVAALRSLLCRFVACKTRTRRGTVSGLDAWPALETVTFCIVPPGIHADRTSGTVRGLLWWQQHARALVPEELPAAPPDSSALMQLLAWHGTRLRSLRLEAVGFLRNVLREVGVPLESMATPKYALHTSLLTSVAATCRRLVTLHLVRRPSWDQQEASRLSRTQLH